MQVSTSRRVKKLWNNVNWRIGGFAGGFGERIYTSWLSRGLAKEFVLQILAS